MQCSDVSLPFLAVSQDEPKPLRSLRRSITAIVAVAPLELPRLTYRFYSKTEFTSVTRTTRAYDIFEGNVGRWSGSKLEGGRGDEVAADMKCGNPPPQWHSGK